MKENYHYEISQEPIVLSKRVIDICLKTAEPSDTIALYTFLYYTAKWQKTNTVKANIRFIMKALKWGNRRVSNAKKILTAVGLIKTVKRNTISSIGWYIEIKFIWSSETVKNIAVSDSKNERSVNQHFLKKCSNEEVPSGHTNALSSISINASSAVMAKSAELSKLESLKTITPPDINWILVYFHLKNFKSDPQKHFNHYQRFGWKVGKVKITDWIANADLWESNEKDISSHVPGNTTDLFKKLKSTAV